MNIFKRIKNTISIMINFIIGIFIPSFKKPQLNVNRYRYYRERLVDRSCYDCVNICYNKKIKCRDNLANKLYQNILPEVHRCIYYIPNKKIIYKNYFIK